MFTELSNFGLIRTKTQALGFYFAYLLLILVLGALTGLALALVVKDTESAAFDKGLGIGAIVGAIVCAWITYTVLRHKGAMKKFSSTVYIVAALGLGLLGGGILGLIIPSYLTTKEVSY